MISQGARTLTVIGSLVIGMANGSTAPRVAFVSTIWKESGEYISWFEARWSFRICSIKFTFQLLVERAVVGLLRIANRNLFRDNTVADDVLQSLSLLLVNGHFLRFAQRCQGVIF